MGLCLTGAKRTGNTSLENASARGVSSRKICWLSVSVSVWCFSPRIVLSNPSLDTDAPWLPVPHPPRAASSNVRCCRIHFGAVPVRLKTFRESRIQPSCGLIKGTTGMRTWLNWTGSGMLLVSLGLRIICSQTVSTNIGVMERGVMPARWTDQEASCDKAPAFRIHEYNSTFFILRQSGCTNFEKPFLYLLFGTKEALLVDTG